MARIGPRLARIGLRLARIGLRIARVSKEQARSQTEHRPGSLGGGMTGHRNPSRLLKNCCAAHLLRCSPPGVLTYRLVRSARQVPPRLASGLARDVFQHPASHSLGARARRCGSGWCPPDRGRPAPGIREPDPGPETRPGLQPPRTEVALPMRKGCWVARRKLRLARWTELKWRAPEWLRPTGVRSTDAPPSQSTWPARKGRADRDPLFHRALRLVARSMATAA